MLYPNTLIYIPYPRVNCLKTIPSPPGFRLTGSGRVFSGCGIWIKQGTGFGNTRDILTGSGIWLHPGSGISKFGLGMRKPRPCWPWNLRVSKAQLRLKQICPLSSTSNVVNIKSELWKTVRLTSFQKPQLQSVLIFFKFFLSEPPFVFTVILPSFNVMFG